MTKQSFLKIRHLAWLCIGLLLTAVVVCVVKYRSITNYVKNVVNHHWTIKVAPAFLYRIRKANGETEVIRVKEEAELRMEGAGIPKELIVKPGRYIFEGRIFPLLDDGLYRWVAPGRKNEQRIVWSGGDIGNLLNSISLLISHGNRNDGMPLEDLIRLAQDEKIALTCSRQVEMTQEILRGVGVKSRIVRFTSNRERNGYNDGHVMIEIAHQSASIAPFIYDVFNGVCFGSHAAPQNLENFLESVRNRQVNTVRLASPVDISSMGMREYGYNFEFAVHYIRSAPKQWYEEMCQSYRVSDWSVLNAVN